MVFAVSPELYDGTEPPTAEDLSAHRLMLWRGNDATFTMIENHTRAMGLASPSTPEIPDIDMLKALSREGLGYTVLPDYVFEEEVEKRPFHFPWKFASRRSRKD